ncbi:hypothetical protein SAMN06265218_106170 [Fodinibius sediminis]|uniref:Uncharacterized protein n=2 Tax=Fodinibius sediminis TaxID=1214077 RepID=A0A521CKZ6_9BACT|nr:hypothetical protein SAMN06265218_106170 [Fodinibius sediminis]
MSLSAGYSVNPYVFAGIYVGAIPFFLASVAWIMRNKKRRKSLLLPVLSTGLCMSSAYIYLIIAGEGVPIWVYLLIVGLLGYGLYSTFRKVQTGKKFKDR